MSNLVLVMKIEAAVLEDNKIGPAVLTVASADDPSLTQEHHFGSVREALDTLLTELLDSRIKAMAEATAFVSRKEGNA